MTLMTTSMRILAATILILTTLAWSRIANAQKFAPPPAGLATLQIDGFGFQEGPSTGDRTQLRAFIWSIDAADQPVLGPNVSLFEPNCVVKSGTGVQCAQLLVVGNAFFGET